ncbi:hypothetical protein P3102_20760 [Amycolatopsis sp. QT-25]|nr:hypothetical protein [Amycolatopsis sp. QT-25]WET76557.1 hypothetical protein P3102_20760 [Amycolatopsis sp. QT-25]
MRDTALIGDQQLPSPQHHPLRGDLQQRRETLRQPNGETGGLAVRLS